MSRPNWENSPLFLISLKHCKFPWQSCGVNVYWGFWHIAPQITYTLTEEATSLSTDFMSHSPETRLPPSPLPMGLPRQLSWWGVRPQCWRPRSDDPALTPSSGRSSGEGTECPLQYSWACLVAQIVKSLPTSQETRVGSLGWEDPLEEGVATHSSVCAITFILESFLRHPLQNHPSHTHTHWPLNSDSFPPGSADHALAAFFPNKVIYSSPNMTFPFMVLQHPSLKIETFLSTITHTWLILISKKFIFHYGLSLHFLVLLGTEVILSGGFLFVSIYVYLPSKC